ncbi:MAG: hypothetical protein J6Y37_05275 [Paludibacteraceae bacterium]|nr:hypothetical protein [Paludibacteraceae bacterium]
MIIKKKKSANATIMDTIMSMDTTNIITSMGITMDTDMNTSTKRRR